MPEIKQIAQQDSNCLRAVHYKGQHVKHLKFKTSIVNHGSYLSKASCRSSVSYLSSDADWGYEKSKQASPFDEVTPSAYRISKSEGS